EASPPTRPPLPSPRKRAKGIEFRPSNTCGGGKGQTMKFTDIFINKPVLAMVVSLFILIFGLRAFTELNVRQYPELRNAVVNVSTVYYGADADLIQGFITTPLEREIASAEGIDYLSSTSSAGVSTIQAYIRLD